MKAYFFIVLLFPLNGQTQSLDLSGLKKLLSLQKETHELVYPGMSRSLTTLTKIKSDSGTCEFKETAVQTVLKIEGSKLIIHSRENFTTNGSKTCAELDLENGEETILFYEERPTLELTFQGFESISSQIKSLSRVGDVVSMSLAESEEEIITKYDVSKPAFSFMTQSNTSSSVSTGKSAPDQDVNQLNLSDVVFCATEDSDECVSGNFSDILF